MKSLLRVRRDELKLVYLNYLKFMEKLFPKDSKLNISTNVLNHYIISKIPFMHKSLDKYHFIPAYYCRSYYGKRYA